MSIEPYRQSVHDEVMTSALVRAAGSLFDDLVDKLLGATSGSRRPRRASC